MNESTDKSQNISAILYRIDTYHIESEVYSVNTITLLLALSVKMFELRIWYFGGCYISVPGRMPPPI